MMAWIWDGVGMLDLGWDWDAGLGMGLGCWAWDGIGMLDLGWVGHFFLITKCPWVAWI